MFFRNIIGVATFILFALSCNNNDFIVNELGLEYKLIEEYTNNTKAKVGDVLSIKMMYTKPNGDVIEESALFRIQLKKASHMGGSIEDALALMHKGDSAIFKINAENYYTKTRGIPLPEEIDANSKLLFYIRLVDVTPYSDFAKEREAAILSDKREEGSLLNDYLKRTNVQVEPTMSGLYYIETVKGQGHSPVPGKKVTVHYIGYFIDGKIFDSSYDRKEPFEFSYGIGQVIQGWDEGVSKMTVGGKCKLIIPSYLAYGSVQRGPIPPNSTLIFEIELLDAEK